jgi:hypothetical protein
LQVNALVRSFDRKPRLRRISPITALLVAACLAAGCESLDVLSPQRSAALLNKIQLGMSKAEVIGQLGLPQKQEAQGTTELLFYRTVWQVAEEARLRSPIAIKDGIVVGFGEAHAANPGGSARAASDAWPVDVQRTE